MAERSIAEKNGMFVLFKLGLRPTSIIHVAPSAFLGGMNAQTLADCRDQARINSSALRSRVILHLLLLYSLYVVSSG